MQTAVHALHSPDLLSEGRGLARFRTGVMVLAMVVLGVFSFIKARRGSTS